MPKTFCNNKYVRNVDLGLRLGDNVEIYMNVRAVSGSAIQLGRMRSGIDLKTVSGKIWEDQNWGEWRGKDIVKTFIDVLKKAKTPTSIER